MFHNKFWCPRFKVTVESNTKVESAELMLTCRSFELKCYSFPLQIVLQNDNYDVYLFICLIVCLCV